MKRFIAVLSGLLIMPAYAEVAPVYYYDEDVEYTDEYITDGDIVEEIETTDVTVQPVVPVAPAASSARTTTARSISRATPAATGSVTRRNAPTRAVMSRTTLMAPVRSATTPVTSRAATGSAQSVTTRRATPATPVNAARAASTSGSLIQSDTVSTPLYNGRVGVRSSTSTAGVRAPTIRVATSGTTAATSAVVDTDKLAELAQLTDYCKAQYTQCMDNYCNVLDDNQGRCSCSVNIQNYAKTEEALKNATKSLQEVAQQIQYLGLTKDEVITLFTQTEAEDAMQGRTDNTQLKGNLDKVAAMIIDVKSGGTTGSSNTIGMDLSGLLDFSFSSTGFDLAALFGSTNTNSISNQRGVELFKTGTARCKTSVLDSCRAQGVDVALVTNAYDLEIDKQCIAYERSLSDANTEMDQTVMNAKNVLRNARLLVSQQKNQYDLRGCINALDSCMQDDFVCGSDYENCIDPTGKYIVNGAVVIGSTPGKAADLPVTGTASGLYSVWNLTADNAWNNTGGLGTYIETYIGKPQSPAITTNMVNYLEQKIGYRDTVGQESRNYGMCISVLNKCQDATYSAKGVYELKNNVVRGFMQRTLTQIKAQQDEILSAYAENCVSEVASCLAKNNWTTTNSTTAENACKSVLTTCVSVTGNTQAQIVTAATTSL